MVLAWLPRKDSHKKVKVFSHGNLLLSVKRLGTGISIQEPLSWFFMLLSKGHLATLTPWPDVQNSISHITRDIKQVQGWKKRLGRTIMSCRTANFQPHLKTTVSVHLCCGLHVKCVSQALGSDCLIPAGSTVLGGWVLWGGGALLDEMSHQRMALRLTSQASLPVCSLLPDCRGSVISWSYYSFHVFLTQ